MGGILFTYFGNDLCRRWWVKSSQFDRHAFSADTRFCKSCRQFRRQDWKFDGWAGKTKYLIISLKVLLEMTHCCNIIYIMNPVVNRRSFLAQGKIFLIEESHPELIFDVIVSIKMFNFTPTTGIPRSMATMPMINLLPFSPKFVGHFLMLMSYCGIFTDRRN